MATYAWLLFTEALDRGPEVFVEHKKFFRRDVFDLLIREIDQRILNQPTTATPLAEAAARLANKIGCDTSEKAVMLARAYGRMASTHRALGRFPEADQYFDRALSLDISTIEQADIFRRRSYLEMALSNFENALTLADSAIEIYRLEGDLFDRTYLGWSYAARGHIYSEMGQPNRTLIDFTTALGLMDPRKDPQNYYSLVHNLAFLMAEAGSPDELGAALELLRAAYRRFSGFSKRHLAKYKLRWLQGMAQVRFGAVRQAEQYFLKARAGLVSLGAPYEVAMISIDLAMIYLPERRFDELARLTRETYRLFQAMSADKKALATLALWGQALREETLTLEFLMSSRHALAGRATPSGIGPSSSSNQ